MIHHNTLPPLLLGLPQTLHQDIHRALSRFLRLSIQHRYSEHDTPTHLPGLCKPAQDGFLAFPLRLAVQIRWVGRAGRLVRSVAFGAGEDVVGGYVDEEDGSGGAERGEGCGSLDVEGSSAGGVAVAFIWESICSTWGGNDMSLAEGRPKRVPWMADT